MNDSPLKILFADDDATYSLFLKRFLERAGYEVVHVPDGKQALEQFRLCRPDLVLLDINMPEINGFEVARQIRSWDKKVLLFFLSDRTEISDRLKGFSLKGNDYIPKPFYPEELLAKIEERFADSTGEDNPHYQASHTLFSPETNELTVCGTAHTVTSRQAEILTLLFQNINQTVYREDILTHVWGNDSYANSLALNVQISYLRHYLTLPERRFGHTHRVHQEKRLRTADGFSRINRQTMPDKSDEMLIFVTIKQAIFHHRGHRGTQSL